MKIRQVKAELFHVDRRTDRRRKMTKLIVAFCSFEIAPKNGDLIFHFAKTSGIS